MQLRFGDCLVDLGTRQVTRASQAVALSPKAFQLLELLAIRRPNAISKEELHRGLWPDTFVVDGNLANLVNELRAALGDDARNPKIIRTVPRFGYAFQADVAPLAAEDVSGVNCRLLWGDREVVLRSGENVIGRDRDAVVWVDDGSVSRHHARIVIDAAGARLEDLESKNGTYVRGGKVGKAVALRDGDDIRLGSVVMKFRQYEAGRSTDTLSRQ